MATRGSRRPSQRPLFSDLPSPDSPYLTGSPSGISPEEMGYDQAGTTQGVSAIRDCDIDPCLLPVDSSLPQDEHYLASPSRSYHCDGSSALVFADTQSPVRCSKYEVDTDADNSQNGMVPSDPRFPGPVMGFNPDIPPYDLPFSAYGQNLGQSPWDGMMQGDQVSMLDGEVVPFDQGPQNPPTAPIIPIPWLGVDDFDRDFQEAFTPLAEKNLSGTAPQFGSQFGDSASVSEFGVAQDQIFDFEREHSHATPVSSANLSEGQAFLKYSLSLDGDDALITPIASPTWKQQDGEHKFQITLNHELPRPTIEELKEAAADSEVENFYSFEDHPTPGASDQNAHGYNMASDAVTPPMLPATIPAINPPRKKAKRSSVGDTIPSSGLIRDAKAPDHEDFTERALVIRVAISARGRQTDFTFANHYDIIVASLHEQLVNELNRKLRVGLDLRGSGLIRNLPMRPNENPELLRTIDFVQKGLQAKIDWKYCQEHMDLLESLDKNKPDLNLEELHRLVRDTGVWVFEQVWQNDHPGQERGAY
jgi:hypothetical protein